MIYEEILRELVYIRIYLGKNIGKISRKEIYELYRNIGFFFIQLRL